VDTFWIGLGVAILALTLLDVFLTALNYDEAGFLAGRLASWQWRVVRRITRRLPRGRRPFVLRQVTGLQVMITVAAWILGTIAGYGFIYLGQMKGDSFKYSGGSPDLFSAMYFSAGQLSTVGGTALLTPNTHPLAALSLMESVTGVVLVSLTLTFVLGVYDVVSSLRSLSAQFYNAGAGVRDPLETLVPYFPDGQERGLDSHLDSLSDSFSAYTDGVRLHHAAYYFQSGRDTFSLPYSLQMLAGVVQGLRWGLPGSHPVTWEPTLLPLTDQFQRFAEHLHQKLRWQSTAVPATVDAARFARQVTDLRVDPGVGPVSLRVEAVDPWVRAFVETNLAMAELVKIIPLVDLDEAHGRYVEWLPFAYQARQFSTAVARDLDYQPLYAGPQDELSVPSPEPSGPVVRRAVLGAKALLTQRVTFIDPGYTRLLDTARVMAGTVAAVALIAIGFTIADRPLLPGAIFAGFVAMFTAASSPGRGRGAGRLLGLVALGPVLLALALDAVVRHEPVTSSAVLVVMAVLSVLAGLYGPQLRRLGVLAFIIYYFTVLLRLERSDLLLLTIPAVVGVVCAVLAQAVPDPGAHARVVTGGIAALERRLVRSVDPLIDAISASRWDPDLQHRVGSEMNRTHHMAAFLVGQLVEDSADLGLSTEQSQALCLRIHDAELALENLVAVARLATGAGMPLEARAQLAGTLQSMQQRMAAHPGRPAWAEPDGDTAPPESARHEQLQAVGPTEAEIARWPRVARRVLTAARQLQRTSDGLRSARGGDLVLTVGEAKALLPSFDQDIAPVTSARGSWLPRPLPPGEAAPVWRHGVQAGTSTAVALFLASLVSSTHQYWAGLPAYQVIGGTDGETFTKGVRKVVGTVLGAVTGFGIAIGSDRSPFVLLPVLAVCVFAATYFRQTSMPLLSFWQTMLFAQLYEYLGRLDVEAIGVRVVETVIGAVVALVVAAVVLPTRARSKLGRQAVTLINTTGATTRAALEVWRRGRPVSTEEAAGFSRDVETMTDELRTLHETVGSVRRGPGAFDPAGIQNQLSRFWELVYHVKAFVTATEQAHPTEATVTPQQWDRLETQTGDNFEALAATYDARPAGTIDPDLAVIDLEDANESPVARQALRSLARTNQTLAIIAADTSLAADDGGGTSASS
jgi:uncharacterized membrane protein YccC